MASQHRRTRRPSIRQGIQKTELVLVLLVLYGVSVLIVHRLSVERAEEIGKGNDDQGAEDRPGPEQKSHLDYLDEASRDTYLEEASVLDDEPEVQIRDSTEDWQGQRDREKEERPGVGEERKERPGLDSGHKDTPGRRPAHQPRLQPPPLASDDVATEEASDDEEATTAGLDLPQLITEIIPEALKMESTPLRDDEQSEMPGKRPFYWWNRYSRAGSAFPEGKDRGLGLDDVRPTVSDSTCSAVADQGPCMGNGFCEDKHCHCAAAYTGWNCSAPASLASLPSLAFNGTFILNRNKLRTERGVRFRTDPLDDPPPVKPFVRVPISRELWEAQPDADRIGRHWYRQCAVVGSSGIMRLFGHGKQIDAADMVIRFNRAPTRGFEKFVGSQTSYRLLSPVHAGWREANETMLLPMPTKLYLYLQVVLHRKHPHAKLFLLDTDFNNYAARMLPSLPTLGFLAVLLAMQRCAKVVVYGFHTSTTFGIPYHYYNNELPRRKLAYAHDLEEEASRLRSFSRHGLVTLADPCAAGCEEPCPSCPPGSTCTCEERFPLPVALPGFCRQRAHYNCFHVCPGGAQQCPGGMKRTKCDENITQSLPCATEEDAKLVSARLSAAPEEVTNIAETEAGGQVADGR